MKKRILFVCLGNICRSAIAEGVMLRLLSERGLEAYYEVDSAGILSCHKGDLPDSRMRAHAKRRGYDLVHRSRPVVSDDFLHFDLILGMDDSNIDDLRDRASSLDDMRKIERMSSYCRHLLVDHVPDPYYGGEEGFEYVIDILEDACEGLLCQEEEKRKKGL